MVMVIVMAMFMTSMNHVDLYIIGARVTVKIMVMVKLMIMVMEMVNKLWL